MSLEIIAELSRLYGADEAFVLAGGGNTSFKDENFLYIKPSGVSLAAIQPEQFVKRTAHRCSFELCRHCSCRSPSLCGIPPP